MTSNSFSRITAVFVLLGFFSAPAVALQWYIKDLGNLGGDDQYAANVEHLAMGINNQGQVVGWSITPTQIFREEPRNFLQAFVSAPNGGALTNLQKVTIFEQGIPSTRIQETFSQATAINDAGVVVFNAERFGSMRTALYSSPSYIYGYPTAGFARANDINNHGQIVGEQLFSPVAFISSTEGAYREIRDDQGNPIADRATGINDSGQVSLSGFSQEKSKAMIWSESVGAKLIATSPDFSAATVGINNSGQILGFEYAMQNAPELFNVGFVTDPNGGKVNYLDTFGGSFNEVMGLNNLGQVVGRAQDESGVYHAYVTGPAGQSLINLGFEKDILNSGWSDIRVAAINDFGQIAGTGNHNGITRPFLLSPIPEPETYAMMLAGLSVLGFIRRRKQGALFTKGEIS